MSENSSFPQEEERNDVERIVSCGIKCMLLMPKVYSPNVGINKVRKGIEVWIS
jgi:hypothetical protein